jgi:predicted MFS family arabinose efflux permease
VTIAAIAGVPPVESEWRAGWRPLFASSIGYGTGLGLVTYLSGLFIRPMQAETGWSTSAVTISPIISILVGLCSPIAGLMVDRWGSRRISLIGLTLLGSGLFMLAATPLNRVALYAVAAGIGIVGPLSSTTPFLRCVASWFQRRTGLALGLAMNGVPLMAFMATPLISWAIYSHGWRAGYVALGSIVLLVGLPAVYLMLQEKPQVRPVAVRQPPGSILRELMRKPPFWLVTAAVAVASVPLGGFLANLQPMLAQGGVPIATAAGLGMVYAISIILGRLFGGYLMDRYWDGGVAFVLMMLSAAGAFMLISADSAMPILALTIGVLLVGMGQGVEADMIGYFALKIFGMAHYSTIVGVWTLAASLFLAAGSFTFARIFDLTGTYAMACGLGAGCFVLSGALLLVTRLIYRGNHMDASLAVSGG